VARAKRSFTAIHLRLEKRSSAITWQNELDKINKIHNCENQEFQEKIDTLAKQRSQTVKEMAEKMRVS